MKKVVILKQTQVTMKTFVPPFFDHFSLNLSKKKKKKKKTCCNESLTKKTKHIYISATNLLIILR